LTFKVANDWGPGATLNVDGVVYLPNSDVELQGVANSNANKCTKIVTKDLHHQRLGQPGFFSGHGRLQAHWHAAMVRHSDSPGELIHLGRRLDAAAAREATFRRQGARRRRDAAGKCLSRYR